MSKKIKTFDILLVILPLLLLLISISVVYGLAVNMSDSSLAVRQIIFGAIGLTLMIFLSFVDYRFFRGVSWILYMLSVLLLIYVDFFGKSAGGAMRWVDLGFFQLQPSEIAKVFLIIFYASFFGQKIGNISWKDLFVSSFLLALPLFLILKEPDLGTALVVIFTFLAIIFFARPTKFQSFFICSLLVIGLTCMLLAAKNVYPFRLILHDYQRNRILTFINPDLDPYGKGYNVRQAQITVGSGGIFGKGLGRGSQSQLQFLPKPQTDFIFSGIAESFGFVGMIVFVGLLGYLIFKILNVASLALDNFGTLLACGTAAMLFFQIFINIGMNLGLVPVTGIPLPFASCGGSALISYFFMLGVVESVFVRHRKITF